MLRAELTPDQRVVHSDAPPDFSGFLSSGQFSDVLLVCPGGGAGIEAHRIVLASQSEIFRTELSDAWSSEAEKGGRVELKMPEDADEEILRHMLCWLYGGGVALAAGYCGEWVRLLCLAHRYMLPGLVEECCRQLLKGLDSEPENAGALLEVAEGLGLERLWCGVAARVLGAAKEAEEDEALDAVLAGYAAHREATSGSR